MLEKKFRLWDNTDKLWICSEFLIDKRGEVFADPLSNNFILSQYTSIKDKNGKEIYEGDVLEYRCEYNKGNKKHYLVVDMPSIYTDLHYDDFSNII